MDEFEFDRLLRASMKYSRKVELVKSGIKKLFRKQRETTSQDLTIAEQRVMDLLQIVHYWHLLDKFKSFSNLINVVVKGQSVPNVSLMQKLVQELKEVCPSKEKEFAHFQLIYKFLRKSEETLVTAGDLVDEVHFALMKNFIERELIQTLKNAVKLDNSSRAAPIPLENKIPITKEKEAEDSIHVAGIQMSALRNQMCLSMLRMKDRDILQYGTTLRRMKYLRSLQIRNSCMTPFGIKVLCNCVPNLTSLDMRNSNLSPESLQILISRLPKLQYLYLSQNNVDDNISALISQKLPKLLVLYVDGNNVTMRGAEQLIDGLRNLRVLSLQNNDICDNDGWRLRSKFCRRGGHLEI